MFSVGVSELPFVTDELDRSTFPRSTGDKIAVGVVTEAIVPDALCVVAAIAVLQVDNDEIFPTALSVVAAIALEHEPVDVDAIEPTALAVIAAISDFDVDFDSMLPTAFAVVAVIAVVQVPLAGLEKTLLRLGCNTVRGLAFNMACSAGDR